MWGEGTIFMEKTAKASGNDSFLRLIFSMMIITVIGLLSIAEFREPLNFLTQAEQNSTFQIVKDVENAGQIEGLSRHLLIYLKDGHQAERNSSPSRGGLKIKLNHRIEQSKLYRAMVCVATDRDSYMEVRDLPVKHLKIQYPKRGLNFSFRQGARTLHLTFLFIYEDGEISAENLLLVPKLNGKELDFDHSINGTIEKTASKLKNQQSFLNFNSRLKDLGIDAQFEKQSLQEQYRNLVHVLRRYGVFPS